MNHGTILRQGSAKATAVGTLGFELCSAKDYPGRAVMVMLRRVCGSTQ